MTRNTTLMPDAADFAAMEERIMSGIEASRRTRTRHHRFIALGAAVVILAGGAGTAWVTLANPVMRGNSAYCFSQADANSEFTQVASPTEVDGVPAKSREQALAATAIDQCASVWQLGAIRDGRVVVASDDGVQHPVPALKACLRNDQVTAVFPVKRGDNRSLRAFCAAVGMEPAGR
jgi:hypothetical protein